MKVDSRYERTFLQRKTVNWQVKATFDNQFYASTVVTTSVELQMLEMTVTGRVKTSVLASFVFQIWTWNFIL
jgi:hypothetical protein